MPPDARDAAYLWDMLDAARIIRQIVGPLTFEQYQAHRPTQLAVERAIEIIGEAARNVSGRLKGQHPEIPWRPIVAQRHVIAHEYGDIRQDRIWRVATVHVVELMRALESIGVAPRGDEPVDQLLQWWGEERYANNLDRVRRFWRGKGRHVVSVNTSQHIYRRIFDDEESVRRAQLQLEVQATMPGLSLPGMWADYGTVSTARYWGGVVENAREGSFAYIRPVAQSVEEALAIEPRAVDDPTMDAARGINLWWRISEALGTDRLWMRTPDMQGPLNTAGLVMNQEEMMMAMYSQPELVHQFLDRVTGLLIDYAKYLRRETKGQICGNLWPFTFMPAEFGVSMTEDLMPLLSAELYKEFGIPELRKIQAALGPLHIHCCGKWGHQARVLKESGLKIVAVEYYHPITRIEELACLGEDVVFVPGLLTNQVSEFKTVYDYYRYLLETTPEHFRYWFAFTEDSPATLDFAREYWDRRQ